MGSTGLHRRGCAVSARHRPRRTARHGRSRAVRNRDPFPNRHTEQCSYCEARRGEEHYDDCRGHLGTGIRNLDGARRDLKRRFGDRPAEQPISRTASAMPQATRFYVTARMGRRTAFLHGPYASHMSALSAVPRARARLQTCYPNDAVWMSIGTASTAGTVPTTKFGR